MSDKKILNRRQFLERAAMLGALSLGAGALLTTGCDSPAPAGDGPAPEPADEGFSCNDEAALEGLSETDLGRRESHQYTDQSTTEGQYCDNCIHWQEPAAGENCGGCNVLPGPYHPQGWCNIWAPAG